MPAQPLDETIPSLTMRRRNLAKQVEFFVRWPQIVANVRTAIENIAKAGDPSPVSVMFFKGFYQVTISAQGDRKYANAYLLDYTDPAVQFPPIDDMLAMLQAELGPDIPVTIFQG